MGGVSPSTIIERHLARLLGPNTARTAVRTFAERALGRRPEDLTAADAPALLAALRPTLRTLLGAATARRVLDEIAEEIT
jgi:hypothetical protein